MKVMTFLFIFVLFFLSSANAKNTFWMGDPPNQEIRQNQAAKWLNCFLKVQEQIPTLSPAEKRWLEVEVDNELAKGTYTQRAMAAMESREYNIRVARSHIERIISTLTLLSKNKLVEKNREVIAWARLVNHFLYYEFWQSLSDLVDRKIIDKEICGYTHVYFINFATQAREIIRRVITHHLYRTLP
jgi:hypothetical protein